MEKVMNKKHCVVYGVGIGQVREQHPGLIYFTQFIDWDLEMHNRTNCEVHMFDPTPTGLEFIATQQLPEGVYFHPVGLAHFDGELELFVPKGIQYFLEVFHLL